MILFLSVLATLVFSKPLSCQSYSKITQLNSLQKSRFTTLQSFNYSYSTLFLPVLIPIVCSIRYSFSCLWCWLQIVKIIIYLKNPLVIGKLTFHLLKNIFNIFYFNNSQNLLIQSAKITTTVVAFHSLKLYWLIDYSLNYNFAYKITYSSPFDDFKQMECVYMYIFLNIHVYQGG